MIHTQLKSLLEAEVGKMNEAEALAAGVEERRATEDRHFLNETSEIFGTMGWIH